LLQVAEVVEGGPCSDFVKEGDILSRVGDVDVAGMQLEDITKFTLGVEGSKTILMLSRGW
jgi:C-terminal processing protease CtpA/Prc